MQILFDATLFAARKYKMSSLKYYKNDITKPRNAKLFSVVGVAARFPQTLAISPQDEGDRAPDHQRDEGENTVAPSVAQRGVHVGTEQGEPESSQTTQDVHGAVGTGGVGRVGVHEVGRHALEDNGGAHQGQGDADVWDDPVCLVLGAPAVPEQADRHEERGWDHDWQSELRLAFAVVSGYLVPVDLVGYQGAYHCAGHVAAAWRDVVECADAELHLVLVCPETGEAGEDEVHDSVQVAVVACQSLDDGLGSEEV